jgi:predicted dienelactone hydrolase
MSSDRGYQAKTAAGPHAVEVHHGAWHDDDRDGREVPWKIFIPEGNPHPAPLVIWSHGAGATRHEASYLGRHLAGHGIAAVHIQHRGTDAEIMSGGRSEVLRAVTEPAASLNRFQDVSFAASSIDRASERGPLAGRLDTTRIGISGHSFGAITAMIVAGQRLPSPFGQSLAVPRIRAAMVMSPSVPRTGYRTEDSFRNMLMPVFHITGTDDDSPMADFPPSDRQIPFRTIEGVDQYLLVLDGANHMTFSEQTRMFGRDYSYQGRERHQQLVKAAAVAYWESRLLDDPLARKWLDDGGFASEIGDQGTFESKPAQRRENRRESEADMEQDPQ